jgi:hypothetical protein
MRRFGDGFALFKQEGRFWVVWVTGFESVVDEPGLDDEIQIIGRRFMTMKSSHDTATFSMASLHSYVVTEIEEDTHRFDKTELVGKGSCLYLPMQDGTRRTRDDEFKKPHRDQQWLFELMDHCVDYDHVEKRSDDVARDEPVVRRRRKRPRPSDVYESDG